MADDPKEATEATVGGEAAAVAPRPLLVTSSPHIRSAESIPRIMWTVSATLIPAMAWAVYVFGPRALFVTALGILTAVATEAAIQRLQRKPVTIADGSAFLTGLLVAFVLPVHMPWYVIMMASFFAIAIVKQAFGGLGCNIWNPALMGRAFVLAAWAAIVTVGGGWPTAFWYTRKQATEPKAATAEAKAVDAVTAATPLTKVKETLRDFNAGRRGGLAAPTSAANARETVASIQAKTDTPLGDLALGFTGGCIGEVSAVALLLGGIILIGCGYVKWHVPAFFIATVALLGWALPIPVQGEGARYFVWFAGRPLFEIFAGGLFLGAFFMATDMVTTPVTRKGLVVFAIGCGILTSVIRRYGGYPEGVAYSILLMNTATPLIDRYTKPKVFGQRPKK